MDSTVITVICIIEGRIGAACGLYNIRLCKLGRNLRGYGTAGIDLKSSSHTAFMSWSATRTIVRLDMRIIRLTASIRF